MRGLQNTLCQYLAGTFSGVDHLILRPREGSWRKALTTAVGHKRKGVSPHSINALQGLHCAQRIKKERHMLLLWFFFHGDDKKDIRGKQRLTDECMRILLPVCDQKIKCWYWRSLSELRTGLQGSVSTLLSRFSFFRSIWLHLTLQNHSNHQVWLQNNSFTNCRKPRSARKIIALERNSVTRKTRFPKTYA